MKNYPAFASSGRLSYPSATRQHDHSTQLELTPTDPAPLDQASDSDSPPGVSSGLGANRLTMTVSEAAAAAMTNQRPIRGPTGTSAPCDDLDIFLLLLS